VPASVSVGGVVFSYLDSQTPLGTWRARTQVGREAASIEGTLMRMLVTGGAGFIGSHLSEVFWGADMKSGPWTTSPPAA